MNRRAFVVLLPVGLADCAAGSGKIGLGGLPPPALRSHTVDDLDVTAPRSFVVSKSDICFFDADIVWRGEPARDRHAQVDAIFEAGIGQGGGEGGSHPGRRSELARRGRSAAL